MDTWIVLILLTGVQGRQQCGGACAPQADSCSTFGGILL